METTAAEKLRKMVRAFNYCLESSNDRYRDVEEMEQVYDLVAASNWDIYPDEVSNSELDLLRMGQADAALELLEFRISVEEYGWEQLGQMVLAGRSPLQVCTPIDSTEPWRHWRFVAVEDYPEAV